MSGDGKDEPVGTVAEEAAKLLGALSGWAKDHGSDLGHGMAGLVGEHVAADTGTGPGTAECRWCPVCRAAHALRQTSPEVRGQLTSAAASLMQAVSAMLATAVPDQHRERGGVEHIDLDDGPEWPDDPDRTDDRDETSGEGDR